MEREFRSAIETGEALLDASRVKPNRDRFFPFLSLSLLFPLLRLLDGYGASVRSRWLVETGEGAHTGPWVPVQGEIDRPTATGIPLTGRQQEQVWNQPPDRQRTLSDGNYVYGWYGQILLDTPISEIYTGCWPVTNPDLSIIKIDSTISIITIYYDLSKFEREIRYKIHTPCERREETMSLIDDLRSRIYAIVVCASRFWNDETKLRITS